MAEEAVASTPPQLSAPPLGSTVIPLYRHKKKTTRIYPKAKEELYSLSSFISFQSIRLLLIFKDNELPSGKLKDLPRGIMHTRSDLELRPQWRKSLRSADNQITGPWIAQGVLLVGKKVEQFHHWIKQEVMKVVSL
ncbi:hypothetical protein E1A91_A09G212200v1 [Gossypium mustelinum]|uniref:Uncharacterized protein n=1 Tax=Gossypium mustelinum TaxID=34275 RepID=A0A5D2Y0J7_GOSMU|nr:hypothetical protein E1A91_A09G212200v1 [Gossypium mustelinum]